MSANLDLETLLRQAMGSTVAVWTRGGGDPFEGSVVDVTVHILMLQMHAGSQAAIRLESIDAVQF